LKGIDIILGMHLLIKYKVLINRTKKSIKLTTLDGKEMEFIAEPVVTAKSDANRVKVNHMDDIQGSEGQVVNDFPDAFPEGLLGVTPTFHKNKILST
jgi:hypothetical protein